MEGQKQDFKTVIAGAWYGEAFHRTKQLQPLDRILAERKQQTSAQQIEVLKQLMARGAKHDRK